MKMKILVLAKEDDFAPAVKIKQYLLENGHDAFILSEKLPPVSILANARFDIGISCHYRHIIKKRELDCFSYGVVNIHPSMLPYGRGSDPVIWSIVNNVPTGMTFHWMDEGLDTGNILFQLEIPRNELETGEELYKRIIKYYRHAFPIFWDELYLKLRRGVRPPGRKQELSDSPLHTAKKRNDLKALGNLTNSLELRTILALTNSEYNNIYTLDENGDRYNIVVCMEKAQ